MASKKDLFSVFRDNQRLFDTPPSPRAWSKLERRLDGHRSRNRVSLIRNLSMAAAVLLLAVVTILISIAVGKKPTRFLNQSPQPLAAEQLQTDDVEAAEELRQALNAQRAEQQRRQPINEGPADRKLVLAKSQEGAAALESVNRFNWLKGAWAPQDNALHPPIHWEEISGHAMEGTIRRAGKTERIRIFQEGSTLYFSADFGKSAPAKFALQYATPSTAVFERKAPGFPQKVTLSRSKNDRLTLRYEQAGGAPKPGLLTRKQRVQEWYKIQLQ